MVLAGVAPTTPDAPQTLAMRFGVLGVSAPVEVTVPPLTLWIGPEGHLDLPAVLAGTKPMPVPAGATLRADLPVGEVLTLRAVATYKSGRSNEIPSHLLSWEIGSAEKAAGAIDVGDGKVISRKTGGGPVPVYATYYGNKSNVVEITPVAAEPLTLELTSKATQLHPGESGVAVLSGKGPRGPVELAPDLATFHSSDEKVLQVAPKSGSYHAGVTGEATMTGSFAGVKEPATRRFTVSDEKSPHGDRPTEVRILSDQGKSVKFPVGRSSTTSASRPSTPTAIPVS